MSRFETKRFFLPIIVEGNPNTQILLAMAFRGSDTALTSMEFYVVLLEMHGSLAVCLRHEAL